MKGVRFDIQHANGSMDAVVVEGASIRIGHGAHCEVRLAVDEAAPEHVLIESDGTRLVARSLASPPPRLDGVPMSAAPLTNGCVLEVNGVRITVSLLQGAAAEGTGRRSRIVLLASLTMALSMVTLYVSQRRDGAAKANPEPKADLFAEPPARCPRSLPQEALALANYDLAIADARAERHPFFPGDGPGAVEQYDAAAVCFRAAGREDVADAIADTSRALRASIVADFRARTLRLDYSVRTNDKELVKTDLAALLTLTESRRGPYHQYLVELERKQK
jgi:hypothetical protein